MNIPEAIKKIGIQNNVIMRVLDQRTGAVVSQTIGHNSATHTMLLGVGHYLKGDGVLNQGHDTLSRYVPRYISLGTMGLINQDQDEDGLPAGIGVTDDQHEGESDTDFEIRRFKEYIDTVPGYGADGYSSEQNNGRAYFGLGPKYTNAAVNCELISNSFPRADITYRVILPEDQSELPETIDVIFSAYISTGALKQFRGDNDYIFITETGLWSSPEFSSSGAGLVAGYRITPTNEDDYDMESAANRQKLKASILRVGKNQIVQVIWKLQIGIAGSFAYDSSAIRYLLGYIESLEKDEGGHIGMAFEDMNGVIGNLVVGGAS